MKQSFNDSIGINPIYFPMFTPDINIGVNDINMENSVKYLLRPSGRRLEKYINTGVLTHL